jgi:hypothetical protein
MQLFQARVFPQFLFQALIQMKNSLHIGILTQDLTVMSLLQ